jgi:hypothetical protein
MEPPARFNQDCINRFRCSQEGLSTHPESPVRSSELLGSLGQGLLLLEPLSYPKYLVAWIVLMIFTTVSYRSAVTSIWLSVPMIVTSSCGQ